MLGHLQAEVRSSESVYKIRLGKKYATCPGINDSRNI